MKTLLFILLAFNLSAQGIENIMLDISETYLAKSDTVKTDCGYLVTNYYKNPSGLIGKNKVAEVVTVCLDQNKVELNYSPNQYVRVNEFQELKQQLHDKKEEFKRLIMIEILAKFCTFMEPEKAAKEAVKYSEALLKELEK